MIIITILIVIITWTSLFHSRSSFPLYHRRHICGICDPVRFEIVRHSITTLTICSNFICQRPEYLELSTSYVLAWKMWHRVCNQTGSWWLYDFHSYCAVCVCCIAEAANGNISFRQYKHNERDRVREGKRTNSRRKEKRSEKSNCVLSGHQIN